MADIAAITARYEALKPLLDERTRRLVAAAESWAIGKGGISLVSRATAISRAVIRQGITELKDPASLAPGKRPRTTLSPTLALRDGEPYLAWGSPGGDQQDQWTTQLFMRHVHAGMNLQEAIDAPAWHSEHFPISFWPRTARPGVLVVEGRLPKPTVNELEQRGHLVEVDADWCEGRLTAAARDGRRRRAAANPRGMQGYAAGR